MHTEAMLPRGVPIRELGTHELARKLPTVLHSPVGICGSAVDGGHGRTQRRQRLVLRT